MAGLCSAHLPHETLLNCPACQATMESIFPGWKQALERAEAAGLHECTCGFSYYKTVRVCPRCSSPREGALSIHTTISSVLEGYPVYDASAMYWSRDLDNARSITDVWWSEKPFVVPKYRKGDNERDYEGAIAEGGGLAYCFHGERILQEGNRIYVLHDPQVFTGREWSVFVVDKEVLSPGDKPEW